MIEGEDSHAQAVIKEILPLLNITQDEFTTTHLQMAGNPTTAEFIMAAQQGKLDSKPEQPKLTKQKTIEVFEKQQ